MGFASPRDETTVPSKHTPAPWRPDSYGVRDAGGYLCKIVWPGRFPGQNERYVQEIAERTADARLIAAAPDLLMACVSLMRAFDRGLVTIDMPHETERHYLIDIRAAISKATREPDTRGEARRPSLSKGER